MKLTKMPFSINEEKGSIYSFEILTDGRIAYGSNKKTIKIYTLKNNEFHCDLIIRSHFGTVYYLISQNDKLISCSLDRTIRVWLIGKEEYTLLSTLKGHNGLISKIITLSNNRMASCSFDKKIIIWNSFPPYQIINTLNGHSGWIYSIIQLKDKECLISSSNDNNIIWWDLLLYQSDYILTGIPSSQTQSALCEIDNNILLIGSENSINVVDLKMRQVLTKIDELEYISSLFSLGDLILFGNKKGDIYKLNNVFFEYKNIVSTAHSKKISCIKKFKDEFIITSSYDGNIFVWKNE